jgi:hypothetical protein
MASKIEKLFETCVNYYDHCGEFDFYGNKIVVFRRCGYYDPKNDENRYVEGDECVIAIVNNEYATDWYCPGENDLKYAMEDAIEWIFTRKDVKVDFEIVGNVESDALYKRQGIKSQIVEALKKEFENFELLNVEVYDSWGKQCKFKVKVQGGWDFYKGLINENPFYCFSNDPLDDGEYDFVNANDNELFDQMFSYKISFL